LLALLRPALDLLEPGGVVAVVSGARSVAEDLPSWCRVERHVYLGSEPDGDRVRHLVERGPLAVPRATGSEMPELADPSTGFAPRGARVEPGGPRYPFNLLERDRVVPPEVAQLLEQGLAAQWSAAHDIPWATIKPLPAALDAAVAQTFTFLAENELSALYVPARFLPAVHPAYVEVAQLLAVQLGDESRHIEVFLRRARAAAGSPISSTVTARSLLSLLEAADFTEATFLLAVLGEGTFLDLLRFVEAHAPDEATAELTRRARVDEARHVHFGLAHVRHALAHDATLYARLESAVRRRSAGLAATGVPAPLADALTVLAAGGVDPRAVGRGHDAYRELLHVMHENRQRRLLAAGFDAAQAQTLSDLHTPNFM
ncbi:MAG TPA: ferritin-like domain-containing protein, partial [Planctomycetota bacterium]|nr:ferritin-like domain-containing protein [Planctomycetota bacterium]